MSSPTFIPYLFERLMLIRASPEEGAERRLPSSSASLKKWLKSLLYFPPAVYISGSVSDERPGAIRVTPFTEFLYRRSQADE